MSDNILNSMTNKSYTYGELQSRWNEVKNKKDSADKDFLGGIFGFDDKKADASKSIFGQIANSDNDNKTISAKDIENLAMRDKNNTITSENFESIYRKIYGDDFSVNKFELTKKNINPFFEKDDKNNSYMDKKQLVKHFKGILGETSNDLKQYIKAHPDDEQAKAYLKALSKNKVNLDLDQGYTYKGMYHDKNHSIDMQITNFSLNDKAKFVQTLLHENGHSIEDEKDTIDSAREERDIESNAINMTRKLYGENTLKELNNKYLEDFEKHYTDLPKFSKGHGLE